LYEAIKAEQGRNMNDTTILLVEDNPEDEFLTLRALKKNNIGTKVFVVRDGVEALDFLFCTNKYADRDPQNTPKLTLLDLKLPKLDGLDVLRRLRAHEGTHLLPIVILSSSNEERDLTECYKSGANSYVRKPVDFNQYEESIRQLGIYWLQLNEVSPN
jgi:two-component system response regulator